MTVIYSKRLNSPESIEIVDEKLPLPVEHIESMRLTQQNPRFHNEGSVLLHTKLVLSEFRKYEAKYPLRQEEKELFYWGTILHDIGKPLVTKWYKGRWISKGHEKAGVPIARDILLQKPHISSIQRRRMLDLVRWHHIPLRYGLAARAFEDYLLMSCHVDLRTIGIFSQFDIEGRICVNKEGVRKIIDQFNQEIVPKVEETIGSYRQVQDLFRTATVTEKSTLWNAIKERNAQKLIDTINDLSSNHSENPPTHEGPTCHILLHPPGFISHSMFKLQNEILPVLKLPSGKRKITELVDITSIVNQFLSSDMCSTQELAIDLGFLSSEKRLLVSDYLKDLGYRISYQFVEATLADCLWQNASSGYNFSSAEVKEAYSHFLPPHPWEAHELNWQTHISSMSSM